VTKELNHSCADGSHALFPNDVLGLFIRAQPEEHRLTNLLVERMLLSFNE